jgi:hypothetical protein
MTNTASKKDKAETDRWTSDADTVERRDREMGNQDVKEQDTRPTEGKGIESGERGPAQKR